MKLAILLGRLRKASFNAAVARVLPALAPAGVSFETLPSVGLLPVYDADIQASGFPASVTTLGSAIKATRWHRHAGIQLLSAGRAEERDRLGVAPAGQAFLPASRF